jgi:hypothetical protein
VFDDGGVEERRVRRSDEPRKALGLFLDVARKRLGVHALSVSTPGGWLVAGAGDGAILVAALAVNVDAGLCKSAEVSISKLEVGREEYVVAALGRTKGLVAVSDGVRRILS